MAFLEMPGTHLSAIHVIQKWMSQTILFSFLSCLIWLGWGVGGGVGREQGCQGGAHGPFVCGSSLGSEWTKSQHRSLPRHSGLTAPF